MKKNHLFIVILVVLAFALALSACSSGGDSEGAADEPKPTAVANVPDQPEEPEDEAPADEAQPAEEEPAEAPDAPEAASDGVLFDTEAMVDGLANYVLRIKDMPNDYRIPTDGEQHLTNLRVINSMGEVVGKHYLAASGRIDGWSLELERVKKEELIPYTIYSEVQVYETAEGAQAAFSEEWLPAYQPVEDEADAPHWVEDGCDIGDACVMYYYEQLEPTTELTYLQYEIVYVYRNVLVKVMGRGIDYDMKPDYIVNAAEILFEKIAAAPTQ